MYLLPTNGHLDFKDWDFEYVPSQKQFPDVLELNTLLAGMKYKGEKKW